ncbi:hypothetical protein FNW54_05400 [Bacteroides sp. HF-5092]|uniref:hypothetical protein n=1 Tax=Bacteroides TaxID=816 RepID=UPI001177EE3D|nr:MULTISPECIES: hypothetical protein [Bacteroides]TRX46881.1 hypothetical protein FNW54_05400 [Bacteroides sp. HF-5092]
MSDIVTRLLLKTNDFDANLNKSKKNVNGFQSDISKMSGVAVSGVMKFAGVLGIAVTASEGFNKVMNSSQTLGDEYARTMDGLKGGVDQFFYSIGSGDWTPFMNGLTETIRLAREAYNAMDQLGNTKMSFSYFDAKNQATIQEQITILKDKDSTEEQKKAARELLDKTLKDQEEIVGQYKQRSQNALQAMVKAAIGLDGVDVSAIDIDKVLRLDVSSAGDEQKAQLAKQYKDFVDEYDRLKAKFTTYETVGSGMNVHTVTITDTNALSKAISPMLSKYQDAIQYNAILVKKSDEWLQNLINVATAAEAAGRNLSSMTKAANRASQSGIGGKTPKEEPKEGSIAWYDTQIAEQNKKLISATDMQARATIQATINELQQKKINLKFVVDQEAFKIAHGGMKDGALSVPVAPTYDKVPTHGKGGENFKLPKYDPLFKKEDVDLNEDYADSLSAISSVMSALNGVTNESAASYLQWGANVISSIAQAIPAILSLTTAKTAEAAANSANSAAQIPFVGWLAAAGAALSVVAAMASIPKFATGGIVPGASFTGDKVPALLNSGEMILNGSQQSNLFKMLNSGLYGSLSQKIAPSIEDQSLRLYSDVEIRGDRIFLALQNHIKKTGKKLW